MKAQTVNDLIAELQALPGHMRLAPVDLRIRYEQCVDADITVDYDGGCVYLQQDANHADVQMLCTKCAGEIKQAEKAPNAS